MEKIVKVNVNIKVARDILGLAGFWKLAENGTDDEVFDKVLDMMTSYGAKTEIIEDYASPDATSLLTATAVLSTGPADTTFDEFNEGVCNDGVGF